MDKGFDTTVAAVKCSSYERKLVREKVHRAIALTGGFPEKIKPGSKILLKPNLLTAKHPDAAVTTHPEILRAVIKELKELGINDITVGDSPAGRHEWKQLWEKTGIKQVAEDEEVKLIPFENIKTILINKNVKVPVLKELDDFDAVISLPKLKTHLLTKITGTVKNSYGLVIGQAKSHFHGKYPSPRKMSSFIADLYSQLKPDFVIMDAVKSMEGDGPNTGKPYKSGVILAGVDGVAVDSCACSIYDYDYNDIFTLFKAVEKGYGVGDHELIKRTGDAWKNMDAAVCRRSKADFLSKIPEKLFFILTLVSKCRPSFDKKKCIKCGLCAEACVQKAIINKKKCYKVKSSKCVLCMCCIEACPYQALKLKTTKIWNHFSS
ncbi:MAG TPA: DUF362 domain-containing protein [Victivallales bacterium]|nr:DUF362 domain-containing protein [Victivallales bacterium]